MTEAEGTDNIMIPSGNEISVAWGDVQIAVHSDQSLLSANIMMLSFV